MAIDAAKTFRRKTRKVVASVLSTPWMLEESVLDQVVQLMHDRMSGTMLSREEISERIGRPVGTASGVVKTASLNFEPDDDYDGPFVSNGIAVLPLSGVMAPRLSWMDELSGGTSTELFQAWFEEAIEDSRVNSILLLVDSPGGSAQGNEELAAVIRANRGTKPIVASVSGMMASAAYWVGSAADEIAASPSSMVGSIGAYMIHGEFSKANEEYGRTYTVIKAGEYKAAGNQVEPLNAKSKAALQERIDGFYSMFVDAVAANRGIDAAKVKADYGQGKVLLAGPALAAGMIDRVETFQETFARLIKPSLTAAKSTRGAANNVTTAEPPAVVSAAETASPREIEPQAAAIAVTNQGGRTMWPKVLAVLLAKGMIEAGASFDQVKLVVSGFCAAKGVSVPSTEEEIVALIDPPPAKLDPNAIALAERNRIADLRTRGELLKINATDIQSAIDSGFDVRTALDHWTAKQAVAQPAVLSPITAGAQDADVFSAACVDGLFARSKGLTPAKAKLSREAAEAGRMSLLDIGKRAVSCNAELARRVDLSDPERLAKVMLMGGDPSFEQLVPRSDMSGQGYNRPGDFPGILSALMGKMLDDAETLVESTYGDWTQPLPSVADFKPKTIHALGEFGELPQHEDGESFDESDTKEEAAWLQVAEFADNWTLTPRMIINDDLDALQDVSYGKLEAHELTQERLCVNLLTSNAPAQDGVALFDSATRVTTVNGNNVNINDLTSGATVSTTQLKAMRKLARKIYGPSLKQKLNQSIRLLLVPEDIESDAEQTLLVGTGVGTAGSIEPTTESTARLFAGRVQFKVVPLLAEASVVQWYALTSSRRTAIVTARLKGYETMRTTSWYDPNTGCRKWNFMGRMAAAIRTWRTIFRNAGQ